MKNNRQMYITGMLVIDRFVSNLNFEVLCAKVLYDLVGCFKVFYGHFTNKEFL